MLVIVLVLGLDSSKRAQEERFPSLCTEMASTNNVVVKTQTTSTLTWLFHNDSSVSQSP